MTESEKREMEEAAGDYIASDDSRIYGTFSAHTRTFIAGYQAKAKVDEERVGILVEALEKIIVSGLDYKKLAREALSKFRSQE